MVAGTDMRMLRSTIRSGRSEARFRPQRAGVQAHGPIPPIVLCIRRWAEQFSRRPLAAGTMRTRSLYRMLNTTY